MRAQRPENEDSVAPSAKDAARALLTFLARPDFRAKFGAAGLDYKE